MARKRSVQKSHYKVVGVMSGTSLDGLDLSLCTFDLKRGKWNFKIVDAITIPYSVKWLSELRNAPAMTGKDLCKLDLRYGAWIGKRIRKFLSTGKHDADFISSHGHTIFHQPLQGLTLQIGNGNAMAIASSLDVVNDFRIANVLSGGEGAPLVPAGDLHLFSEYPYCLNLGGIANLSLVRNSWVTAFDICICNIGFNHFANLRGRKYDGSGKIGQSGRLRGDLLRELDEMRYFRKSPPKSLDSTFFTEVQLPVIDKYKLRVEDQLYNLYQHVANQISRAVGQKNGEILVTGGGAHNRFLISLLEGRGLKLKIPDTRLVDYKESMIFAFLGVLRMRNEVNCFASVTGSESDQVAGIIHRC